MDEQSYYSDTREWQTGKDRLLRLALLLTIPIGIVGFRFLMRSGPILFILLFFILVFIVYQILDMVVPPTIHKKFYVPRYDAQQIVQKVLTEKNYPYQEKNGRFVVGAIKISIKTQLGLNLQSDGCIIQISPFREEDETLIYSLCTKIDNAFAPKGLQS